MLSSKTLKNNAHIMRDDIITRSGYETTISLATEYSSEVIPQYKFISWCP